MTDSRICHLASEIKLLLQYSPARQFVVNIHKTTKRHIPAITLCVFFLTVPFPEKEKKRKKKKQYFLSGHDCILTLWALGL